MKSILDASVSFRDPEILEMVTKADMVRVLTRCGWKRRYTSDSPIQATYFECWTKRASDLGFDERDEEVVVVDRCGDRVARIGEFVQKLHEVERLPTLRVILALLPQLAIGGEE